jgi:hypothetical protein
MQQVEDDTLGQADRRDDSRRGGRGLPRGVRRHRGEDPAPVPVVVASSPVVRSAVGHDDIFGSDPGRRNMRLATRPVAHRGYRAAASSIRGAGDVEDLPGVKPAPAPAKNDTLWATSSGCPTRPTGMLSAAMR